MDIECKHLKKCGFLIKYKEIMHVTCKSFINDYCKGPFTDHCKRNMYLKEKGKLPPDEMLPV